MRPLASHAVSARVTAVTASTKMDSSTMVLAGVDAGANIFVDLTGGLGVAAAATAMKQNDTATLRTVL